MIVRLHTIEFGAAFEQSAYMRTSPPVDRARFDVFCESPVVKQRHAANPVSARG